MAGLKQEPRSTLIPVLYAVILLLLALAAWNPTLPDARSPVDLMLVMDESASIDRNHNDRLWTSFLRHGKSLPAGSRVSLIRFADRAGLEVPWTAIEHADFAKLSQHQQPPRQHYLDRGASDIRSAVSLALQQASPDRHSLIIISSDGKETGDAQSTVVPVFAQSSNFSFFHVRANQGQAPAGVEIDSIDMPSRVAAGQSLPISIAIRSSREGEASLEIIHNRKTAIKQDLALQPGALSVLNYALALDQPGTQTLEFLIHDREQNIIDKRERVVDVSSGGRLLYIGTSPTDATSSLALPQGWQTVGLQPGQPGHGETFFNQYDVVLLDDLEASSINPVLTRNLQTSVQQSATGLIVIGGPRSFGSGGYRHSQLEEMLPVTAESSRKLPASAFLFLVDKSGSMDASNNRQSRLADAFRAVLESAKSIRPGDESALLAFDRDVQVLLPLRQRADLKSELDRPWSIQASGGTRLAPALNEATALLASSDSEQRFLILVTDGIVELENIGQLVSALQQASIRLIALATGDDANLASLRQLAHGSGGQVLQITDSAELPRFMRQQLEKSQYSWSDIPVTPQTILDPPFIDEDIRDWKSLQGYQITRSKPGARVYLASPQGDPLLALGRYGAGRVAALPGGMLETRSGDKLSQALIGWMNNRRQNPDLQLSHHYASARLTLVVDAIAADNSWQSTTPAQVILTNPAGIGQQQSMELEAPGRFSAVMEAPGAGVYTADIIIGDQQARFSLYLKNDAERMQRSIAPWFQQALDSGAIIPWTETDFADALSASRAGYETGPWWLLLALLTFIGLMALEYSSAFYWLAIRIEKQRRGNRHE